MQPITLQADKLKIAVATNFLHPLSLIAHEFESQTGHSITLIPGSTGKLYAQIINGAPYDAFFAADVNRPLTLELKGVAQPGSRFTYAIGQLVLWSPDRHSLVADIQHLPRQNFRFLAIANPELAPYGRAARQVLQAYNVWDRLQGRMVRGENIGQTFQFVISGNAEVGLIAFSQLKHSAKKAQGTFWIVPPEKYDPIEQQAVLIKSNKAAGEFLSFCRSDTALKIIHAYGYHTP